MSRKTENLSLRVYLIEVTVEQVNILIKFPCTISVSMKIGIHSDYSGRDEIFSNQEVKPIDNRVPLSQKLQLRTNMVYDTLTHQFTQNKAAIHVHVNSLTGRNTAGVSKLDLAQLISKPPTGAVKCPLERCPDRHAEISYRLAVRFEGQLPYQQQSVDNISHGQGKQQSDKDSRGELSRIREIEYPKDEQPSFGGSLLKKESKESRNSLEKDILSSSSASRHRILDELDAQGPNDSAKRNKQRPTLSSFRPNPLPPRQPDQPSVDLHTISIPPLGPSAASRVRTTSHFVNSSETLLEAERKIARLEAERQNQLKMIASLNSQLELNKAQLLNKSAKQSQLVSEIEKFKRKIDAQQIQLQNSKKSKIELQKQLSARLADQKSNSELQHRLSKTSELQIQAANLRKGKQQADRLAKQKQKEYNILLDKVQDLTNTANTNQKRLEMKDAFYKEEVKKYSEKLVETQLQKQKLMSEIETLKNSLQDKNRKIEILTRDRDRHLQDEKVKFNKKIDQMKLESESLQAKRNQDHQQLVSLGQLVDKLRVENTELGLEKIRLEQEIERLRNKLMADAIYKNKYEEQLKEKGSIHKQKTVLQQQLEADRRHLTLSADKVQKQLTEKQEEIRQMIQRQADLQKQLKQKDVRVADQDFEIESLRKKCQTARKNEQKKAEELLELQKNTQNIIQSENNKRYEASSTVQKYEREIAGLKDAIHHLNEQLAALKINHQTEVTTIQAHSQNHADELEQTFSKLVSEKETMEMQLSHERIQLLQSTEKYQRLLMENDNLNNLVFELRNQVKDYIQANNNLDQNLYELNQAFKNANSQIQTLSQQKSEWHLQAAQTTTKINQLLTDKQNNSTFIEQIRKEHSQQLNQATSNQEKVHSRNKQLLTEIQNINVDLKCAKDALNAAMLQNTVLLNHYESLKKDCDQLTHQNQLIKNDIKEILIESQSNTSEVGQLKLSLKQYQQMSEAMRVQSESFKKALEDFSVMLNDFMTKQEIKSITQIQSMLSHYQKLPSKITGILSQISEERLKHQQEQRIWSNHQTQLNIQISNLKAELISKQEEKKMLEQNLTKQNEQILATIDNMRQEQGNIETNLQDVSNKLELTIKQADAIQNQRLLLEDKLRITLTQLDTTKANLEHEIAQLTLKQAEIDVLTVELNRKSDEFNNQREKVYREQSDMFKELETTKIKLTESQEQIKRLIERQQLKQYQLIEAQQKLTKEVSGKSILISHLESLLSDRNSHIEELEDRFELTSKKDKEASERLIEQSKRTLQQEAALQRQILQILDLTSAVKDLEAKIQIIEKEKENQLKRINQLIDEVNGCDYMLNTLKSDLQTTQQQLDDSNQSLRRRDAEKSSLQEELINKSKTMTLLNQEISKLKDLVYRINRSAEDKESEITESTRQSVVRVSTLEKELQMITNQYNTLKEKLKQEQNLRISAKRASEKEIEELTISRDKLEAEVMELNEQIYSISSDVNTMRLREQQDQDNMERLQNQLSTLASMYVAEKKKCEILQQNNSMYQSDMTSNLQPSIRELRLDAISKIQHIRRLQTQNNQLRQQIIDNPMVRTLEQKIEETKRDYSEELAIMQQIINRERKDYETMRRQYHQKCIINQHKIRVLQVQFRNEKEKEKEEEDGDRLETIEEEKSSTMSEMGNPMLINSPDRPIEYTHESDVDILRQQLKNKDDELLVCSLKIRQLQNIIERQELNGHSHQLLALQEQIKIMVSQKLYFMSKINQIRAVVMRIKSKTSEYNDFSQEFIDLTTNFRLLQAKLIEVLEHSTYTQQEDILNLNDNQHTLSQSTGIVESNSHNQRQFNKAMHEQGIKIQESDRLESTTGLANRLKANLSNYKN